MNDPPVQLPILPLRFFYRQSISPFSTLTIVYVFCWQSSAKMTIAFITKNLTFSILKHSSPVGERSPSAFSFSLRLFSTSTESQLGNRPTLLDILLHKHNFPSELASRVASELSFLKSQEKAGAILSFFKNNGFSDAQLIKMVRQRPRFLTATLDDSIKPKIEIFRDLGLSSGEISKLISNNPAILHLSLKNNIIPSLSLLNGLLGSNYRVGRVIALAPRLLAANFEKTVTPNVELLKSCGISMHRICMLLSSYPSIFSLKPKHVRKSAEKATEMGIDASCNNFIYAIRALLSLSNAAWDIKLQGFRGLGFSDRDILIMFRKTPEVFCVSMEKIKKIIELFLATGKFNLSSIVGCPKVFKCSVEKRCVPRLQILGILESRNLIIKWPSLAKLCTLTDAKFSGKFIIPYPNEISDV